MTTTVLTPEQIEAQVNAAGQTEQGAVVPLAVDPTEALKSKPGEPYLFTLTDGRTLVLQKPVKPVSFLIARCLGQDSMNGAMSTYYKALVWVRRIDQLDIPNMRSNTDFDWLLNQLGDDALDELVEEVFKADIEAAVAREEAKK